MAHIAGRDLVPARNQAMDLLDAVGLAAQADKRPTSSPADSVSVSTSPAP